MENFFRNKGDGRRRGAWNKTTKTQRHKDTNKATPKNYFRRPSLCLCAFVSLGFISCWSLDDGLHYGIFEIALNLSVGCLNHVNGNHFLFGIHPEVSAESAAPPKAAVG